MDGRAAYADRLHAYEKSVTERPPPDAEGLQHQALVMPQNDRARRPVRVRACQLRSKPVRGTLPAWL